MSSFLEKFGALTLGLKGLRHSFDTDCDRLQRDIRSLDCQCKKQVDPKDIAVCKQTAGNIRSVQNTINELDNKIRESYDEIAASARAAARDADRMGISAISNLADAVLNLLPGRGGIFGIDNVLRSLGSLAQAVNDVAGIDRRIQEDMSKIRSTQSFILFLRKDRRRQKEKMDEQFAIRRDKRCSDSADRIKDILNAPDEPLEPQ